MILIAREPESDVQKDTERHFWPVDLGHGAHLPAVLRLRPLLRQIANRLETLLQVTPSIHPLFRLVFEIKITRKYQGRSSR